MICELVTAVALNTAHVRPVGRVRRMCLAALLARARREGAIVVDFKHGRVILPPVRALPVLSVAEVLEVVR